MSVLLQVDLTDDEVSLLRKALNQAQFRECEIAIDLGIGEAVRSYEHLRMKLDASIYRNTCKPIPA